MIDWIELKGKLAGSPFRMKFNLREPELHYIAEKGPAVIEAQCREFIAARLAPAAPFNDGRQTPWRGHPCFVAQHATGACCRGGLAKWQHISSGRELTDDEIASIVKNLMHWIREHTREGENMPHTPELGLEF